jgi:hypothetical protein
MPPPRNLENDRGDEIVRLQLALDREAGKVARMSQELADKDREIERLSKLVDGFVPKTTHPYHELCAIMATMTDQLEKQVRVTANLTELKEALA